MSVNGSINSILREDALELLKGLPFAPKDSSENSSETGERFNRVFELPEFPQDNFLEWGQTPPIDAKEIPETNIDLLAWYQPYSNYGPAKWGIYFDSEKMTQYALKVYAAAKLTRPQIKAATVFRAVWDEVMRHEREHAVQEITLAVLVTIGIHPGMDSHSVYTAASESFEALATHYEHTDAVYRKPSSDVIDRNFVKHITASIEKPAGYRNWNRIDLDFAAEKAYGFAYAPDLTLDVAIRVRKLVRKVEANKFVDIPIYIR